MFPNLTRAREAGADSRRRFLGIRRRQPRNAPALPRRPSPGRSGRRRLAPAISFLWNDGGAGRASASYGVSVAATGSQPAAGMALPACFLSGIFRLAGVGALYPFVGWGGAAARQPALGAGDYFFME